MTKPEIGSSILLVDDDETFRARLGKALAARGYEVRLAADPIEALRLAEAESPELALVDLRMPSGSGLELWDPLESTCRHASLSIL